MTVIHPNSISGITSVTSHSNSLYFYESDHSTKLTINAHVNGNVTAVNGDFSGNLNVGGVLTYEDVTNIDAVGIITAQSDVSIADKIIHTGDTDTALRFPAADTFTVETAGSERVRVNSSGNIGIGTDQYLGFGPELKLFGTNPLVSIEDKFGVDSFTFLRQNSNTFNIITGDGSTNKFKISKTSDSKSTFVGGNLTNLFEVDYLGNTTMIGNVTIADSIIHSGDTNTKIRFPAVDTVTVETGGTERLRIDSSGRLQIGASNNSGANTKLVVGAGNNINTTAIINTGDVDVDALTLSNWDGSTTTNKVTIHFDSSGIGGWNIGMPAATDAFVIEDDGGSEKLRITSGGAVTKPSQPGFIARYSVNDTVWNVATDGWTKILFDEENMDRGGNYSTANSEFTAPVAGMYLFGAELQLEAPNGISSGYLTSGSNWMYITFVVNGATTLVESKGGTRTDANFNAVYNSYTPTHLLNLTAGDTVSMYRTGNYTSIKFKGGSESVFWGYLVG